MRIALAAAAAAIVVSTADARTWRVAPGPDAQGELQSAFAQAEPGDTVRLDRGRYEFTQGLRLAVDHVTVRGDGEDRTILSFAEARDRASGFSVTANGAELRDFAVEDASGGAVLARDCEGITMRGVRAERTGGFGLHVTNCSNVRIEDSIARDAGEAGIGVGGSRGIIVRRNLAERNAAGIAIENSQNADVFENSARHNAAGVAVMNLPGLPQQDAHGVRVFGNTLVSNDAAGFAALPSGAGVFVMAGRGVHVFDNEIGDSGAANVIVSAYGGSSDNPAYSPLPNDVMIRDNRFGAVSAPAGEYAALTDVGATAMPDVLWDGADTYFSPAGPRSEIVRIVMRDNRSTRGGIGSFLSLGLNVPGAPLSEAAPDPAFPPLVEIAEPDRVRID